MQWAAARAAKAHGHVNQQQILLFSPHGRYTQGTPKGVRCDCSKTTIFVLNLKFPVSLYLILVIPQTHAITALWPRRGDIRALGKSLEPGVNVPPPLVEGRHEITAHLVR